MSISIIAQSIAESATLKLNEKAALLKAKGEPIIHLGGGEPKTAAPVDAIIHAVANLNSGETRYTPADGTPEMKQAVIRYTEEFYDRKVEPENIIVSGGAKQAIMVALQTILNPQDEVIFPAPYWVSYTEMVKLCGAVPVPVYAEDGTFYPRMKDIEDHVTSYTKAVIINSPNNPTGAFYSEEFIAQIVEYCEKKGFYLIMDDIYHRLLFDGKRPINCYRFAKDLTENSKLIVINGVSKQYAMTGYRIGWAVAAKRLIVPMTNIQAHQTSGPSVILQKAAVGAINGVQSSVDSLRRTLENNRNVMMQELNGFDGVHVTKPDGTFYCFADFKYYTKLHKMNTKQLADLILEKVRVAVVPGIEFGMEGYFRLSTCGTVKDITEGVKRIKWALDPNSPNELYIGQRKLVRDWV
ncbi:MAG: pyridoxal phosphate-dependent aminotransferase [bacterium]